MKTININGKDVRVIYWQNDGDERFESQVSGVPSLVGIFGTGETVEESISSLAQALRDVGVTVTI
jgi:SHS2 domain-containing protein